LGNALATSAVSKWEGELSHGHEHKHSHDHSNHHH
jgi:hypothetical protein